MYTIYALVDPRDEMVHYVGMTEDVYRRFIDHLQGSGTNYEKNAWVHEMRKTGVMIQMRALETCENALYARKREVYWITHYTTLNHPLTNIISAPAKPPRSRTSLDTFITPRGDLRIPDEKQDDLAYFYTRLSDVKKALRAIGVSNRAYRHASYVLEERGLKVRKA